MNPFEITLHMAAYIGATIMLAAVLVLCYLANRDMPPLNEPLWARLVARVVTHPPVLAWLIARAMRTPYTHLDGYMERYWLFNPYEKAGGVELARFPWLPWSIRLHHILRKDLDRHMHDHPWNARTFILRGSYMEERVTHHIGRFSMTKTFYRVPGDTARIGFGQYHNITDVTPGGVWTLFITSRYKGTWGFLVNGVKVPWSQYLQQHCDHSWSFDSELSDGMVAEFVCDKCGHTATSHGYRKV